MNAIISISARNKFNLNLLNALTFLVAGFSGALIELEYHMHGLQADYSLMGLDKPGWLILHKVSASIFIAGILIHCWLNWKFILQKTRRSLSRKCTLFSSLSYSLLLIFIPTSLTAIVSWTLFDSEGLIRFLLIEIHDKLGWPLLIFVVIHGISRINKMTHTFRRIPGHRISSS